MVDILLPRCGKCIMAHIEVVSFVIKSGRKMTIDVKFDVNVII
jgi:hypothetical protein